MTGRKIQRMLFGQYIREVLFFILRMFAAYGSRVQVSPNSLLKIFFCWAARRYLLIGAFTDLRHTTIGFVMSVLPFVYVSDSSWTNSAPTERIFMKLYSCRFFENLNFLKKIYDKNNVQFTRKFIYIYSI